MAPPDGAAPAGGPGDVAEAVAAIVRDVLGADDVSPDANFFEIGGDSLAAIEVVSRVEDTLGVTTSVDALYDTESLRDFAATLSS